MVSSEDFPKKTNPLIHGFEKKNIYMCHETSILYIPNLAQMVLLGSPFFIFEFSVPRQMSHSFDPAWTGQTAAGLWIIDVKRLDG